VTEKVQVHNVQLERLLKSHAEQKTQLDFQQSEIAALRQSIVHLNSESARTAKALDSLQTALQQFSPKLDAVMSRKEQDAVYAQAMAHYENLEYSLALQQLLPLGLRCHPKACAALGIMYAHGQGVVPDFAEAIRYLSIAAQHKNSKACAALGAFYAEGKGVPKDPHSAFKLFEEAVIYDSMNPLAVYLLGECFEKGTGVMVSAASARELYERAAKLGHPEASAALNRLHLLGQRPS